MARDCDIRNRKYLGVWLVSDVIVGCRCRTLNITNSRGQHRVDLIAFEDDMPTQHLRPISCPECAISAFMIRWQTIRADDYLNCAFRTVMAQETFTTFRTSVFSTLSSLKTNVSNPIFAAELQYMLGNMQ
jgi:hypothetical protein